MKEKLNLEKQILDLVLRDNYQPLKPKAIAKKLKVPDELREVKRTLKRLIKQGQLQWGPKHLVLRAASGKRPAPAASAAGPGSSKDEVIGLFRRNPGGFGFVRPQGSTVSDRSEDIFIPQSRTLDAADRDTVRIRVSQTNGAGRGRRDSAPRVQGRIVEVIQRHTHQFVGTYAERSGLGLVTVDGGQFDGDILVGDASAKNGRVGDKVVIEMVHFPSPSEPGEAVIVEILGRRGQPGVDTLSIIRQYGLPEEFPEPVLDDARQQADGFDEEQIAGRTDFTGKTVITIDPKTARDFDDAISLERLDNGNWELGVHIADVSHFVPAGSKLDQEAFARGTSVYLPDRVIPMLPEIISNNLASLQPHRIRYCMSALIEFSPAGIPLHTELHRGAIRSCHRFNYEEIDDYLADPGPWKKQLTPQVFTLVGDMHSLAMTLRQRRLAGGAINLVLPEVKIDLDDDGQVAGAHTVEHTESHQVIEEFMLAANEAVARHLDDQNLDYLRRIHPLPTEIKLEQLTSFVRALGIECGSLQDRFEMKRVVEASEGMPEAHAIHYAVLRSMQKAVYSPEDVGHYALNSKHYCHFTSPIRRYPDLIIHRMVGDLIDGRRPDANYDRLMMLGEHCSDLEKRATEAERELTKLKLLNFMQDRIGSQLQAVITGVESFGIFVQGIEIPAEGLLPLENLPPDSYRFDRPTRTLSGHKANHLFRLGDTIRVKVALVDPDQRLLEFDFAGRATSGAGRDRPTGTARQGRDTDPPRERGNRRGRRSERDDSRSARSESDSRRASGKRRSSGAARASGGSATRGPAAESPSRSRGQGKGGAARSTGKSRQSGSSAPAAGTRKSKSKPGKDSSASGQSQGTAKANRGTSRTGKQASRKSTPGKQAGSKGPAGKPKAGKSKAGKPKAGKSKSAGSARGKQKQKRRK